MREILFRGKRVDNGEWIEGYYYKKLNPRTEDGLPLYHGIADLPPFGAEVIHETVGQYTGLTDKNGKKIFEGDIARYDDLYGFAITIAAVVKIGEYREEAGQGEYTTKCYGAYAEVVKYELEEWADYFPDYARTLNLLPACNYYECEVIGNKWDNPELLEVE